MTIDFCSAIGPWAFRRLPTITADECRRELKREGIDMAVASSLPAVIYKNPYDGNFALIEEIGRQSEFFIPFAVLNPMFPGWEEDFRRCAGNLGMKGLRLYPNYQGFDLESQASRRLVRMAADEGWVTQVSVRLEDERHHHWDWLVAATPVAPIAQLAIDMPDATVVLSGGSAADIKAFFEAVGDAPNAYAEIGYLKSPIEAVKSAVADYGVERLLLGTNAPFIVPYCATEKVTRADISDDVKQAILGGNASRILGLS